MHRLTTPPPFTGPDQTEADDDLVERRRSFTGLPLAEMSGNKVRISK